MFAFLFDENHPEMEAIFGPQCASVVIEEIERMSPIPATRLLTGSLLHDSLCYRLDSISYQPPDPNKSFDGGSQSHALLPNYDIRKAIICDLAETLSGEPSSFSEDGLLECLAQRHIWIVGTPHLTSSQVITIHAALLRFGPYLGFVVYDDGNPLHRSLFLDSLFRDKAIGPSGFIVEADFETDPQDTLASEYNSKNGSQVLDTDAFERAAPRLSARTTNSERGNLSALRARGEDTGHRAKVARALMQLDRSKYGNSYKFSARKPNDGIEFLIDPRKLTDYLLSREHHRGKDKAAFFADVLHIESQDWRYLADQLSQAVRLTDLYKIKLSEYGASHGSLALVTGRNNRQAVIETAWQLTESGPARFVTAYPAPKEQAESLIAVVGRVPPTGFADDERWHAIHNFAHQAGLEASDRAIPPPMVLEQYGTIWEGECGFGWVLLPDGRKQYARWVVGNGHGRALSPGVTIWSPVLTQSVVKNRAYAEGYAEVLRANGIECSAESRLD